MNPLDFLIEPLEWLLNFLHDEVNLTYGWAIVVLTVIVRLVLLPLVRLLVVGVSASELFSPPLQPLTRARVVNAISSSEAAAAT